MTTEAGEVLCRSGTDWVVYDVDTQQIVVTGIEPGHVYLDAAPYRSDRYAFFEGVSWSPDSRYLAVVARFRDDFPLELIDLSTGQVDRLRFVVVDVEVRKNRLSWSPDSRRLAFWVTGSLNEEVQGKALVFYDTATDEFTVIDQTINPLGTVGNGYWSPDGTRFAFIDETRRLVLVDATTGAFTILDSDVVAVDAWASIVPPDADAGTDKMLTDGDGDGSEIVLLDASASVDPDGVILSYKWDSDGIEIGSGATVEVNLSVGTHLVELTVTDDDGGMDTDVLTVTIMPLTPKLPAPDPTLTEGSG
ncbi:MAG: PD40 domain-containing protein [Chloroflexi bacterium]|nr:PD40 domain-containing protein [Chloroflexota bacterium]